MSQYLRRSQILRITGSDYVDVLLCTAKFHLCIVLDVYCQVSFLLNLHFKIVKL